MKHTIACMAFLLFFVACDSNKGGKETQQTQTTADGGETLTGNWYRQYEGTIAGKHVVVDLEYSEGRLLGTYTYDGHDLLLDLFEDNESSVNDRYYIYESNPLARAEETDTHNNPHWEISFSGNRIHGIWVSKDAATRHDIDLKEVDYKNSYRFNMFIRSDSTVVALKGFSVGAQTTDKWCMPGDMASADKEFLTTSILKILGCKPQQNAEDCVKKNNEEYFANYRNEIDSNITEEESHIYNHESSGAMSVSYNKNGLVILQSSYYQYMGGAHGMHGVSYECIDVTGKKVWELKDVMTVDTNALSAILEAEARRIFKIPAAEPISERLLTDTIEPTENFYFTSAGITFQYNPYEIASYADGEVCLFIPFSRLMVYLTPEFKKRMKIQ